MVQARWPSHAAPPPQTRVDAIDARTRADTLAWAAQRGLSAELDELLSVFIPLADFIAQRRRSGGGEPLLVGIAGAQGTGKSTATALLAILLERGLDLRAVQLSLDDVYLPRAARAALARDVHPLLATRGVPGTHDLALGIRVLEALRAAGEGDRVHMPRFDKAHDDRMPEATWPELTGPFDVVLFEGWCIGARAEPAAALADPLNALEREQDPDGAWRRYVNAQLAGPYRMLFDPIDLLIFLAAPDLASSLAWRTRQEHELAARSPKGAAVMTDAQVAQFVQYYERISRHMLSEVPARADVVMRLDGEHGYAAIELRRATP
jgi:D-glycerate 3-kinase